MSDIERADWSDDDGAGAGGEITPPTTITCVDCGGTCHLLTTPPPDDPFQPGDVVAYRCEDCRDRWDLVLPDDPDDDPPDLWS